MISELQIPSPSEDANFDECDQAIIQILRQHRLHLKAKKIADLLESQENVSMTTQQVQVHIRTHLAAQVETIKRGHELKYRLIEGSSD